MTRHINLLRRGIVRPKTNAAVDMLRLDLAPPLEAIEWYQIQPFQFERHFQVFNDLARTCGIAEDDFAVEEVELDRLPLLVKTLKSYHRSGDVQLEELIDYLWGISYRALKDEMPVFFVL